MDTSLYAPLPDLGMPVNAVEPKLAPKKLKTSLRRWVGKQGLHWPKELAADKLLDSMTLCYLPYWTIQGKASANWAGEIKKSSRRDVITGSYTCGTCNGQGQRPHPTYGYKQMSQCPTCGGSGSIPMTTQEITYHWTSKKGQVDANINIQLPNVDPAFGNVSLQIPPVELKKLTPPNTTIPILRTDDRDKYDLETIKNTGVQNGLVQRIKEKEGGSDTRNISVDNVTQENVTINAVLYPAYVSTFEYGGEKLTFQVDATGGNVFGEIPSGVWKKRVRDRMWLTYFGYALVALLIVLFLRPLGIATFIPGCNPPTHCINSDAFNTALLSALLIGGLISWPLKAVIPKETFRQRLLAGVIAAALTPLLTLVPSLGFNLSALSPIQIILVILAAFSAGTSTFIAVIAGLFFSALVLTVFKVADIITIPALIGAYVGLIVFPEIIPPSAEKKPAARAAKRA